MKTPLLRTATALLLASTLFTHCSKKDAFTETPPTADFSVTGTGTVPATVTFTNASSGGYSYA